MCKLTSTDIVHPVVVVVVVVVVHRGAAPCRSEENGEQSAIDFLFSLCAENKFFCIAYFLFRCFLYLCCVIFIFANLESKIIGCIVFDFGPREDTKIVPENRK